MKKIAIASMVIAVLALAGMVAGLSGMALMMGKSEEMKRELAEMSKRYASMMNKMAEFERTRAAQMSENKELLSMWAEARTRAVKAEERSRAVELDLQLRTWKTTELEAKKAGRGGDISEKEKGAKRQQGSKEGNKDFESEEWRNAAAKMGVNEQYARLFGMLELPPDVEDRARELLTEYLQDRYAEKWGGKELSGAERRRLREESRGRLRAGLSEVLTAEELETLEEYEDNLEQFEMEQHFATQLRGHDTGLTESNREAAAVVLAEELVLAQEEMEASDKPLTMEDHIAAWLSAFDQARERLPEVLDAEQLARVERYLQQEEDNMQIKIDAAANIAAERVEKEGVDDGDEHSGGGKP